MPHFTLWRIGQTFFECNSIKVNGEFVYSNVTLLGPTRLNGGMNVKNGKFQDIPIRKKESVIIDSEVSPLTKMDCSH